MHGHPTLGVKGAKPRLSSRPGPKIGKLSEEYLEIRKIKDLPNAVSDPDWLATLEKDDSI